MRQDNVEEIRIANTHFSVKKLLKWNCQLLGFFVEVEGEINRDEKVKVLITNHISSLDHIFINLVCPCVIPGVWDLPVFLEWALGIKDLGARRGREVLISNTKNYCQTAAYPVLIYPEGSTTNGKVGLLKFGSWPFSLDKPIQPIAIKRVGSDKIALCVIGSRWWTDLLWVFFSPITTFKLKVLPVVEKTKEETVEDFSKRVQQDIANELNLKATNYTCHDKLDYVKKILFEQKITSKRSNSIDNNNSRINKMCLQVKEVIPHVPLNVIKKDIVKTNSVDTTIMHLLEGTIAYTPEKVQNPSSSQSSSSSQSQPSPSVSETAAKSFQKTSEGRHLSLQERKLLLIENAKRRYIEKHKSDMKV
ncbi:Ancient ubiquitous protein 1 [Nymphon striatum]|nr:Ancient ubiquitous protein 1 [Nymphon striatum]